MHIPDGFLSPSTCAVLYGGALPFWYTAVKRAQRTLTTQLIPMLSAFSAFCFVIMMFNLPLPGGTTGHAVGVGIATIVLGPWGSILSISVALVIQAVFFGDGGITTLGANCFNMAVVGSLVAYAAYRIISRGAPLRATRRVVAAGISGYLAINASALCAAIEFGLQPALFRDASGAPLYAPYPLSIAVPAMMIGHMTLAGLAEVIVTAGVVAYLQRSAPALLAFTAPDAPSATDGALAENDSSAARPWRLAGRVWAIVAVLMVVTPLGLLAAGTAWGEWSPGDFADPAARAAITSASRNQAPPAAAPGGLTRLSTIWTAPLSHYAPPFMKNAAFGYVMSAMLGGGVIILVTFVGGRLMTAFGGRCEERPTQPPASDRFSASERPLARGSAARAATETRDRRHLSRRKSFLERTTEGLLEAFEYSLYAEERANTTGLLQRLDPRIKLVAMASLIVATAMAGNLRTILASLAVVIAMVLLSRTPIKKLASRVWLAAFMFTGTIALPAIFITPGRLIARVPFAGLPITAQGLTSAVYLLARVETISTIAMLLVLTTAWPDVLKALRVLGVPALAVVVLGMSYRYAFLMLQTAHDMFESRRSRMAGSLRGAERRRVAAATVGVLLAKAVHLGNEVYVAMVSRGFRGEAYTIDEFKTRPVDWVALVVSAGLTALSVWFGRKG